MILAAPKGSSWPIAAPRSSVREAMMGVSEAYYDEQQKGATLHDLRMPTR